MAFHGIASGKPFRFAVSHRVACKKTPKFGSSDLSAGLRVGVLYGNIFSEYSKRKILLQLYSSIQNVGRDGMSMENLREGDSRPIGVFDSGLGGLTMVREFVKYLPGEHIVYFGDTGRVPYGSRSPETIVRYARQDENFLLSKDVKMIIAACGTVSAVAGQTSKELPVPFLEVVSPAARAAVSVTKTGRIGVIGTSATIASGSYTKHILALRPDAKVTTNDCPLFVPLVEAGWIDENDPVTVETARRYLAPMEEARVDTLILGCTHYPVLSRIIAGIMGKDVTLINTGQTAAAAAARYLEEQGLLNTSPQARQCRYYVSDRTESFSTIASILLGREISDRVERVDIANY